jgi:hypothetical protein
MYFHIVSAKKKVRRHGKKERKEDVLAWSIGRSSGDRR